MALDYLQAKQTDQKPFVVLFLVTDDEVMSGLAVEKIYEQQAIHGKEEGFADVAAEARSSDEDSEDDGPPGGAPTRIDHGPYGKWQVVEKKR